MPGNVLGPVVKSQDVLDVVYSYTLGPLLPLERDAFGHRYLVYLHSVHEGGADYGT